jgi:EpsI family protein
MNFRALATIFILAATAWLRSISSSTPSRQLVQPLSVIPNEWQGYHAREDPRPADELAMLRADETLGRFYQHGDTGVSLFIAYYMNQDVGTIPHSPLACLPLGGWEIAGSTPMHLDLPDSGTTLNLLTVRSGPQRILALYWYQNAQRLVASELAGKLYLTYDRFVYHSTAGSFARVAVDDRPGAQELAVAFSKWVIPQLQACLR